MLKRRKEFKKAYTLNRRELEEHIEQTYGVNNFSFVVREDDSGRYLSIKAKDLLKLVQTKVVKLDPKLVETFDLGDYAHEFIRHVTGDDLHQIILRNDDDELLCLV